MWDSILQSCVSVFNTTTAMCGQLASPSYWFDLLLVYKYWVVAAGALIEGEIILMMAAAAAYHGHIVVYNVALFAAVGAIVHDHVLYALGLLFRERFEQIKERYVIAAKVERLIQRYGIYFVCSFRFLYGVRTLTPLMLGAAQKFSWRQYTFCVCLSAVIWACLITYLGYTFAIAFEWLIGVFKSVKSIIVYVVLGVIVMIVSIFLLRWLLRRIRARKQ